MRHLIGSLLAGCLLLVLVVGCSCKPEAVVSPPTDTPFPTSTLSPTPTNTRTPRPTKTLKPVAGLDTSLLTDDPCRAPCWHSITPGVSTESDVRAVLESSPFVRGDSLGYGSTEEEGIPLGVFHWQGQSRIYNHIYLRDQVVLRMEIEVDHNWTLGDVVNKFGPPEYIYARRMGGQTGDYYAVNLYYPAQGLAFHGSTYPLDQGVYYTSHKKVVVSEDIRVTNTVYFAPASLEGMASEAFLCPPDMMERCLADIHKWGGFDQVKLAR